MNVLPPNIDNQHPSPKLWWEKWGSYVVATVTTVLLFLVNMGFERTSQGHTAILSAYAHLHRQIDPIIHLGAPDPQVAVVDISKMARVPPETGISSPTSLKPIRDRKVLLRVLREIAHLDPPPRAIGVDVDFSPENDLFLDIDDPKFFEDVQQLRDGTKVPIFLGVGRRMRDVTAPLGKEQYSDLAAGIAVARESTPLMPLELKAEHHDIGQGEAHGSTTDKGAFSQAATLCERMAKQNDRKKPPSWLAWALEPQNHMEMDGIEFPAVLVNFSKLEYIKASTPVISKPSDVEPAAGKLRDRYVILGDADLGDSENPEDRFRIPGHRSEIPGVFLHACALYSLVDEPVFEFRVWFRLLLDLMMAFAVVSLAEYQRNKHHLTGWIYFRLEYGLSVLTIVAFFFISRLLAGFLHILYLDAVLVVAALCLHAPISKCIHIIVDRIAPHGQPPTGTTP